MARTCHHFSEKERPGTCAVSGRFFYAPTLGLFQSNRRLPTLEGTRFASPLLLRKPIMSEPSAWIFDATAANFQEAVVDRSMKCPVIVDFWAPWCQPCRTLGPMLERLIDEAKGKAVLAKINIDEEQELAGAFGVQSIPSVFAIVEGQLADQFQGLLPEPQLREWLKSLLPSAMDELLKRGQELEATTPFPPSNVTAKPPRVIPPTMPSAFG